MKVEVIRTNGTRETHEIFVASTHLKLRHCKQLIGCETVDTVNLKDGRVMMVDDNGWECQTVDDGKGHIAMVPIRSLKPINDEATKLYHSVSRPGTTHQIAGDVVIVLDRDFE